MSETAPVTYSVELPVFEGPLDLLLHLVKKHELDIFDIPVAFVTEKYLEYLDLMRALNLEIAGEYLLMAATLAYIKSRELLPTPDPAQVEEEGEEGLDPREELIRRLLEYQKYKEAAAHLSDRPVIGRNVWTRGSKVIVDDGEAPLAEVGLFKLVEALGAVMARAKIDFTHDVVVDRVSIADRIGELADRLVAEESFTFESCFQLDGLGETEARLRVVTTFLAILEMARLKMVRVHQVGEKGTIYVSRRAADLGQAAAAAQAEIRAAEEEQAERDAQVAAGVTAPTPPDATEDPGES